MTTTSEMLNQRSAAASGVSRTTIRRRRKDGCLPGAVQDPERGWLIPVEDLLAAGFRLNAPGDPDINSEVPAAGPRSVVVTLMHCVPSWNAYAASWSRRDTASISRNGTHRPYASSWPSDRSSWSSARSTWPTSSRPWRH